MSLQPIDIPYLIPDMPTAEEILPFLKEIDSNRWYTNFGPLVARLLDKIRDTHFSDKRVNLLLCNTGTSALELGLLALGMRSGARVLVPAFTFPATANAIQNCGFEPVFCDVDEKSWIMTPDIAMEVISKTHVDAIMPVAALGRPVPVWQWDLFAEKTGLPVIIDAAAALGNQEVGRHAIVAFSLHATKAFGIGEGGILASQNEDVISRARRISNFGMDMRGRVVGRGTNAKLSEYHAAVGLAQIARWPMRQLKRARVDAAYQVYMKSCSHLWTTQSFTDAESYSDNVLIPHPVRHNRSTMPVLLHAGVRVGVESVQEQLLQQGIGTRLWYNPGLHRQPHWVMCEQVYRPGESTLAMVERLNERLIGLPFHNFLEPRDIGFIVGHLRQIVENKKYSASLSH